MVELSPEEWLDYRAYKKGQAKPEEQHAEPAAAPASKPAADTFDAPAGHKHRVLEKEDGKAFCTDCAEKFVAAEKPDQILKALNNTHKHGSALKCTKCRAATLIALAEPAGMSVFDEGDEIILKKKEEE